MSLTTQCITEAAFVYIDLLTSSVTKDSLVQTEDLVTVRSHVEWIVVMTTVVTDNDQY